MSTDRIRGTYPKPIGLARDPEGRGEEREMVIRRVHPSTPGRRARRTFRDLLAVLAEFIHQIYPYSSYFTPPFQYQYWRILATRNKLFPVQEPFVDPTLGRAFGPHKSRRKPEYLPVSEACQKEDCG
ncbi:hypothetical protein J6590_020848 [Homalodisca vitripennis]|nr:hypothetical protein J6590_020848 [Homalodisca vitripennis]